MVCCETRKYWIIPRSQPNIAQIKTSEIKLKQAMIWRKAAQNQVHNAYILILQRTRVTCGPGSSVGIATGYGLDGPGIESRWGRDFPHLSRPVLGPTQPPVQWAPGISRGQRAAGAWRRPLIPFFCRGHERVELYLYSPGGRTACKSLSACTRVHFTLLWSDLICW
jgi:hypothetical protein